jgi:hypothetical protein
MTGKHKYNPQIDNLIQEIVGLCYKIKTTHGIDVSCYFTPFKSNFRAYTGYSVRLGAGGSVSATRTNGGDGVKSFFADLNDNSCVDKLQELRNKLGNILKTGKQG